MDSNKKPSVSDRPPKKRIQLSSVVIVAVVLLLAAGVGFIAAKLKKPDQISAGSIRVWTDTEDSSDPERSPAEGDEEIEDSEQIEDAWGRRVEYNGETYSKINNLKTVLFLGIDNADIGPGPLIGRNGRADMIVLFVMDPSDQSIRMMSVSRDTIVDVDVYDTAGLKLYTGAMQITMQYSFGTSAKRGCRLMQRRVGELIHGIDIDGYFSITMDGLPEIVNGIGGLTLTIPEDYSYIDAAYTEGAVIEMNGEEALRFVRYRDSSKVGSNTSRMNRNAWFIGELFRQMHKGRFSVSELLELADAYIETDLDADTMKNLTVYSLNEDYLQMPGKNIEGSDEHDEYYVDDDALIPMLLDLYYEKK